MTCAVILTVLISASTACGLPPEAESCQPLAATDVLYLDGERYFHAVFDYAKCESTYITAADLIENGTLAVVAPSHGFNDVELVEFVESHLEPAGLRPLAVYYYLLTADRAGVAHLPVVGSLGDSLESAASELQRLHPVDEAPPAGTPVPFVVLLEVATSDQQELTAALEALSGSPYAFQVGTATVAPPPFDPARDRMARERAEDF